MVRSGGGAQNDAGPDVEGAAVHRERHLLVVELAHRQDPLDLGTLVSHSVVAAAQAHQQDALIPDLDQPLGARRRLAGIGHFHVI